MKSNEHVLEWVRSSLNDGSLKLGDRLPGERGLAQSLGVSRTAVREALRVLESLGIVRSAVGSGPAAGTTVIADPGAAFSLSLDMHLASKHISAHHVVEARLLLETWAAGSAAGTDRDWFEAEDLLVRMDQHQDATMFLELDAQFHVLISGVTTNPLIGSLVSAIRGSIAVYTRTLAEQLPNWEEVRCGLQEEHRAILRAFRDGDGEQAGLLIHSHIEGYYLKARMHESAPTGLCDAPQAPIKRFPEAAPRRVP